MKRTPFTMTDSMELVGLRVAIGKIANKLSIETPALPVKGKTTEDLIVLAKTNERGWNTLAQEILDRLDEIATDAI